MRTLGGAIIVGLFVVACGGADVAVPPPIPPLDTSAPPPPPPPPEPDPSCQGAVAQNHAKTDTICKSECVQSNVESCARACERGDEEACWRGADALRGSDPAKATALFRAGCPQTPATDFGRKNCRAIAALKAAEAEKAQAAARDAAPPEFEGTLVSRSGATLRIKMSGAAPPVGSTPELQRYFESKPGDPSPGGVLGGLFGATLRGWVGIASTRVDKIDRDVVLVTITQERSKIVVNGKAVNHFTPGARMRFLVPRATPPG